MTKSDTQHFAYRAVTAEGSVVRGRVNASSREVAVEALTGAGLWPLEIRMRGDPFGLRFTRRRFPTKDIALGLRVLAELLSAALPLERALTTLEELAPPAWQAVLPAVREAVRQGKSLGAALSASCPALPQEILGIIRGGEAGSGLAGAVRRAAQLAEEKESTRSALQGALAYPLILATVGTLSVTLLVAVVLPRFANILAGIGQSLPPTTLALVGMAGAIRDHAGLLVATLIVVVLLFRTWVTTETGRHAWHSFLLELPLLGGVRQSAAAARACAALSALLESGVRLVFAMPHAAGAMGDAALGARLLAARERILHGDRLSHALAAHQAMRSSVVRLVRAGEESGRLAEMLAHAARLERDHAVARTKAIVRLIEPTLILVFGAVVAFVAAALLQALYSIRPGA